MMMMMTMVDFTVFHAIKKSTMWHCHMSRETLSKMFKSATPNIVIYLFL